MDRLTALLSVAASAPRLKETKIIVKASGNVTPPLSSNNNFTCDVPGCKYSTSRSDSMKTHNALKHGVNVTWYRCDVENCTHKAKQLSDINRHKAHVHDIGVRWFPCSEEGCEYSSKVKTDSFITGGQQILILRFAPPRAESGQPSESHG